MVVKMNIFQFKLIFFSWLHLKITVRNNANKKLEFLNILEIACASGCREALQKRLFVGFILSKYPSNFPNYSITRLPTLKYLIYRFKDEGWYLHWNENNLTEQ